MFSKDLLKTAVLFVLIILTTVGSSLALNLVTGPKIAADKAYREELAAQQAAGELLTALPGATAFEEITSTLTLDEGGLVIAVHKETSGKGYVFIAQDTFGMMVDKVKVTIGVNTEGKIAGSIVSFANTADFGATDGKTNSTLASINGLDSTLGGYVMSAGATHSSTAIKSAINAGFLVLSSNGLMKAAAKTTEQVFEDLLPTVFPSFVKGDALTPAGNVYEAYKAKNSSSYVAYVNKDDTKLLTITNINKVVKVYEAELVDENSQTYKLNDVTSTHNDVVTEVASLAELKTTLATLKNKLKSVFGLSAAPEVTEIAINDFGTITAAGTVEIDGETYYTYQAKPINDFDGSAMSVYVVLNSDGSIYTVTAAKYFYGDTAHFQPAKDFAAGQQGIYEAGFKDKTSDTLQDSDLLITNATFTTNAMKKAVKAVFAEFAAMGGNN